MPMSSETPDTITVAVRPKRGAMLWCIALAVLMQGIGPLLILLQDTFYPENMYLVPQISLRFLLASYAIALVTMAIALRAAWHLIFGQFWRQLKRGIIGIWIILPGHGIAVSLLHWYALWQNHTQIYDVEMRLEALIAPIIISSVFTLYLLRSTRMRGRFPVAEVDVAAVF